MSVGQIRFPRWIEVCGKRIYIPEDQLTLHYMEERLPIDLPAYCPSETSFAFPNDADASLIRLGAMRVGRIWMPTVYKTKPGRWSADTAVQSTRGTFPYLCILL